VCATFDLSAKRVRLVWHRTFQPSPEDPLDFEATIEKTLIDLRRRFWVREIRFDPWQMQAVAQRLIGQGLPMLEFPQSVPNLTAASTNLYELLKGRNLTVYPDDDLRLALSRCVAVETSRGWRITKEKASHKIDVAVALAQAALGAVEQGQVETHVDLEFQQRVSAHFSAERAARGVAVDGPRGPAMPTENERLWGDGAKIAASEDRAAARPKKRWGRWASF
jgi:hypothetical protein